MNKCGGLSCKERIIGWDIVNQIDRSFFNSPMVLFLNQNSTKQVLEMSLNLLWSPNFMILTSDNLVSNRYHMERKYVLGRV